MNVAPSAATPIAVRISATSTPKFMPRVVGDGSGGAFIAWLDQDGTNRPVCAQRLMPDAHTAPGWSSAGTTVSGAGWFDGVSIAADGAGGAYIAWDTGSVYGSVGLRHVDAAGVAAALWSSDEPLGQARAAGSLSTRGGQSPQKREHGDAYPMLAPDSAGGVFFAWQYSSQLMGNSINVYRYGGGAAMWSIQIARSWSVAYPVITSDGDGGAFVAWMDGYPTHSVYMTHIMADGSIAAGWTPGGIRVCANSGSQAAPGIVSDGAGGAIIAWADSRDATHDQVFAQRMTSDGLMSWAPDGVCLCSQLAEFGPNRFGWYGEADDRRGTLVSDGLGGAIAAWVDHRGGSADVYAQRISANGSISSGWPADGVAVCAEAGDQLLPAITCDGYGATFVAWQDGRDAGAWTLRYLELDAAGQVPADEPPDGIVISATPQYSWSPVMCPDGDRGAFVGWVDVADSMPAVYASHLAPDQAVPALVSLVEARAEAGRAHLTWYVDTPGFTATVERRGDRDGWQDLALVQSDAEGHIEFEDRAVSPGARYQYRLRVGNGASATWMAQATVTIPAVAELALAVPSPNPVVVELRATFVLASSAAASLEVVDIAGRVVAREDVGSLGPGSHTIVATRGSSLPAGMYLLRLTQGRVRLSRRVVVVH